MRRILFVALALLLLPSPLFGASPIDITSDSMVVERGQGLVTFKGNVVARKDDLLIKAEELRVFYGKERDIERIVALGKVRIEKGDTTAWSEKAEFFNKEDKLVLTGDPKVVEGKNSVEGERITLFLKEGRSIVEGGEKRRVRAIFVPREGGKE